MKISCAILAGGKNSRYGGLNKAFIPIEGIKIIDRNIQILKPIFQDIHIVTNAPDQFIDYRDFSMSSDYYHDIGPLAGIHSALKNTSADAVFITSCDMPFPDSELINRMLSLASKNDFRALVPRWERKIEPLYAVYHCSLLPVLEEFIEKNTDRSIRGFIKSIDCNYFDLQEAVQPKAFTNINSPDDLKKLNLT